MPFFRVQFFFNLSAYGWSETMFTEGATHSGAFLRAQEYAEHRRKFMASNVVLKGIRISDEDVRGDSYVEQLNYTSTMTEPAPASDEAWTCLLIRLEATTLHRRNLFASGIPDIWAGYTTAAISPATAVGTINLAIQDWLNHVASGVWRIKNIVPEGQVPFRLIVRITGGPTRTRITFAPTPTPIQDRQEVRIEGIDDPRYEHLNGAHVARQVTDDSFEIAAASPDGQAIGEGRYRPIFHEYTEIDDAKFLRIGHRDRGVGNFLRPRGRQRNKCRGLRAEQYAIFSAQGGSIVLPLAPGPGT